MVAAGTIGNRLVEYWLQAQQRYLGAKIE
jgi:hypothetical protein